MSVWPSYGKFVIAKKKKKKKKKKNTQIIATCD